MPHAKTQRRKEVEQTNAGGDHQFTMTENDVATVIVDAAFQIHQRLGPGLLETVYEVVLAHELRKRGLEVQRQVAIPIRYDDLIFEEGFRADVVVQNLVIVELKSVEELAPVHSKQVLTQIRLADKKLGLLINFGSALFKNGVRRIANGLPEQDTFTL